MITCASYLEQQYLVIVLPSLYQQIERFACAWLQLLLALCRVSEEVSVGQRSLQPRSCWDFQNGNLLCSSFCQSFRLLESGLSPAELSEGNPKLGFGVR